jgi:hypothetical protein
MDLFRNVSLVFALRVIQGIGVVRGRVFAYFEQLVGKPFQIETRAEKGDVPGWVLVVLMTAGLVTGIWTVAAPRLNQILKNSLDSINAIR